MFSALQLNQEAGLSTQSLQTANNNFLALEKVVAKELQGEALTQDDNEILVDFTKQLKIESAVLKDKQLTLRSPKAKKNLYEDLSQLKLMVLIHQNGAGKVFSVGPVWDYQESQ